MDKNIRTASKTYRTILINEGLDNVDGRLTSFVNRLADMYASEKFREHNVYPTMNVSNIYAVIAMCIELKGAGMDDAQIIDAVDKGFEKRRSMFKKIIAFINMLPNSFNIVRKWNINDHAKRVDDKSITYDYFKVSKDKIEYRITKCMYVEMFESYGIRPLCRIFCMTDEFSYAGLTRHVKFNRHSELATGNACSDEVIRK